MKIFKIMMIALVAMCGLNSCSDDCDHDYIEVDYSKKLAGTWTCMEFENDFAEALIFKADGTVTSTGVFDEQFYEKKGTYQIKGNQMTLSFEDGDYLESRFEMVEGEVFSLVDDLLDVRYNYYYCENDLSDEIVGMWVCNDGPTAAKGDMMIQVFNEDGSSIMTGQTDEILVNDKSTTYKVVGDMLFLTMNKDNVKYESFRMTYAPNGTALGDIMTLILDVNNANIAPTTSWLRVKQHLDLAGKVYDYSTAYVTNVKGKDEDFSITGSTFNMANIKAGDFDMLFRTVLFCVEFPNANTIKQHFLVNGIGTGFETPIIVEGNKVTLDMSAGNPAFRKVEMYMFQDKDDSQLHMYMPTSSFINYFANLEFVTLLTEGKIDPTDDAAIAKVFADMEARIESINVSFVMKVRK